MVRINGCRPFMNIRIGHVLGLENPRRIFCAENIRAHFRYVVGNLVGIFRAQVIQAGNRIGSPAALVKINQDGFIFGEQVAMVCGELAVGAVRVLAVTLAHMLAVQADNHKFAVDTDALIGFGLDVGIACGGGKCGCGGKNSKEKQSRYDIFHASSLIENGKVPQVFIMIMLKKVHKTCFLGA